jgi:hypothetical protein
MSYHIIYGTVVLDLGPDKYGIQTYALLHCGGSSNVYCSRGEHAGMRSRDWSARVVGPAWRLIGCAAEDSAACSGGMLKLAGRGVTPEAYIRHVRRALAAPLPLAAAAGVGIVVKLNIILPAEEDFDTHRLMIKSGRCSKTVSRWPGENSLVYSFAHDELSTWLEAAQRLRRDMMTVEAPAYGRELTGLLRRVRATATDLQRHR